MNFNETNLLVPSDVITFGKYKGKSLAWILEENPSYIVWLSENNVVKISDNLLTTALSYTMPPNFEELHIDCDCRC